MIGSVLAASVLQSTLLLDNLRTESLTDPVGIDRPTPHFSWELLPARPDLKDLRQTAYRILVSTTPEKLAQDQGDLWDSGKVDSGQTYAVPYQGKTLTSNLPAWWKVQVWDQDNNSSDWSKTATFATGLLQKSDWKAQWVSHKPEVSRDDTFDDTAWIWSTLDQAWQVPAVSRTFTRELTLSANIESATLMATADDQFEAEINGQPVGKSDGQTDAWRRPQTFDVTGVLKPGQNTIKIVATNAPGSGYAGLIAKLVVTHTDGKKTVVSTDGEWKDEEGNPVRVLGFHGARPWGQITLNAGRPSTLYRKEFTPSKPVKRAVAFTTALGLVDLHLNGSRITEDLFTPGWTDYNRRLYYRAFDITDQLQQGANCLAAELGCGWYAGYIGWNLERDHYGDQPAVLIQLEIEYEDGTQETVATDSTWQAATGGTVEQDFLMGETFDAREHEPGWSTPGFSSDRWVPVETLTPTHGELQAFPAEPVQVYETLAPVSIKQSGPDRYIVDFGQVLAGFARIKFQGAPGQKIELLFAEVVNPDGSLYRANLRGARSVDTFVADGKEHVWEPRFTFHGFRYVEIVGWGSEPKPEDIQALAISSATPEVGTFESSDAMLNQLAHNAWWTQKMNFIDIPTDCPQRDERLGWTGDAQAYIRTASYYSDVQAFFNKWLTTLDDAQEENGNFPRVAPVVMNEFDGGPAWADAGVICPWAIYEFYGDKRQLAEHYPAMKKFVDFTKARSKPDLLPPDRFHCFGDWLQINANTPNQVIYTAYFAGSARIVAQAAEVLGHAEDAKTYHQLADDVKAAFNRAYVTEDGKVTGETQCSYVLALAFDLLSPELAAKAADHLVADIESRDWHLSTGFVGTRDLMHVLTKIDRNDVAFRLLHNKTFPSWGFPIVNGATSIWERWDGWTPENGFQTPGMNSFSHYAYGAVMQWVFENIGGIKPLAPGFAKVQIAPAIDPNLTHAKVAYQSIRGKIATEWEIKDGKLTLTVTVPPNTEAQIQVPNPDGTSTTHTTGSGTHTYTIDW